MASSDSLSNENIQDMRMMYDGLNHVILKELTMGMTAQAPIEEIATSAKFLNGLTIPIEGIVKSTLTEAMQVRKKMATLCMYVLEELETERYLEMEKLFLEIAQARSSQESITSIHEQFRLQAILKCIAEERGWVIDSMHTEHTDPRRCLEGLSRKKFSMHELPHLLMDDEEAFEVAQEFPYCRFQTNLMLFFKPILRTLGDADLLARPDFLAALRNGLPKNNEETEDPENLPCMKKFYAKSTIQCNVEQDLGKHKWLKIEGRRKQDSDSDSNSDEQDDYNEIDEDNATEQETSGLDGEDDDLIAVPNSSGKKRKRKASSIKNLEEKLKRGALGAVKNIDDPLNDALNMINNLSPKRGRKSSGKERKSASKPRSDILGGSPTTQPKWTDDESVKSPKRTPRSNRKTRKTRKNTPSPLKKKSPKKTQKRRRWEPEEETALIEGVEEHGAGNWMQILRDDRFKNRLLERTAINLKDKWRNLQS